MNEKEKWTQRAQEAFDAMTQETRESFEEAVARSFSQNEEGVATGEMIRERCITNLAGLMAYDEASADATARATEFVTEELYERYREEEFARLVELPEYSEDRSVPSDVLLEAVVARLISEHPGAAR